MWTKCSQDCQCQRSRPASCAKRKLGENRSPHKLSLRQSGERCPGMGAARNPRRRLSMARIHRGSPPGSLAKPISPIVSEPLITARRRCQVRVKASPSFSLQAPSSMGAAAREALKRPGSRKLSWLSWTMESGYSSISSRFSFLLSPLSQRSRDIHFWGGKEVVEMMEL